LEDNWSCNGGSCCCMALVVGETMMLARVGG